MVPFSCATVKQERITDREEWATRPPAKYVVKETVPLWKEWATRQTPKMLGFPAKTAGTQKARKPVQFTSTLPLD